MARGKSRGNSGMFSAPLSLSKRTLTFCLAQSGALELSVFRTRYAARLTTSIYNAARFAIRQGFVDNVDKAAVNALAHPRSRTVHPRGAQDARSAPEGEAINIEAATPSKRRLCASASDISPSSSGRLFRANHGSYLPGLTRPVNFWKFFVGRGRPKSRFDHPPWKMIRGLKHWLSCSV